MGKQSKNLTDTVLFIKLKSISVRWRDLKTHLFCLKTTYFWRKILSLCCVNPSPFPSHNCKFYEHLISPFIISKSLSVHKFKITSYKYDFSCIHLYKFAVSLQLVSPFKLSLNVKQHFCLSVHIRPLLSVSLYFQLACMLAVGHSDTVWIWWGTGWVEVKGGER